MMLSGRNSLQPDFFDWHLEAFNQGTFAMLPRAGPSWMLNIAALANAPPPPGPPASTAPSWPGNPSAPDEPPTEQQSETSRQISGTRQPSDTAIRIRARSDWDIEPSPHEIKRRKLFAKSLCDKYEISGSDRTEVVSNCEVGNHSTKFRFLFTETYIRVLQRSPIDMLIFLSVQNARNSKEERSQTMENFLRSPDFQVFACFSRLRVRY